MRRAKQDAWSLTRQSGISRSQALNQIASENGVPLPWDQALRFLYQFDRLQYLPDLIDAPSAAQLRALYPEPGKFSVLAGPPGCQIVQTTNRLIGPILGANRNLPRDTPITRLLYSDWALNPAGKEYIGYLTQGMHRLGRGEAQNQLRTLRTWISNAGKNRGSLVAQWRLQGCRVDLRYIPFEDELTPQHSAETLFVGINTKRDGRFAALSTHLLQGGRAVLAMSDFLEDITPQGLSSLQELLELAEPRQAEALNARVQHLVLQQVVFVGTRPIALRAVAPHGNDFLGQWEYVIEHRCRALLEDAARLEEAGMISPSMRRSINHQLEQQQSGTLPAPNADSILESVSALAVDTVESRASSREVNRASNSPNFEPASTA